MPPRDSPCATVVDAGRASGNRRLTYSRLRRSAKRETARLTAEFLRDQLGRLGNTPYELGDLELKVEGSPFAPASAAEPDPPRCCGDAAGTAERTAAGPARGSRSSPGRRARRHRSRRVRRVSRTPPASPGAHARAVGGGARPAAPASITLDYLDLYGLRPSVERVQATGIEVRVASPAFSSPARRRIVEFLLRLRLSRSWCVQPACSKRLRTADHPPLIGDFSLNAANSITADLFLHLGLTRVTPTHDLNAAQVAELGAVGGRGPDRGRGLPAPARVPHRALRLLPLPFDRHELQGLRPALRYASRRIARRRPAAPTR